MSEVLKQIRARLASGRGSRPLVIEGYGHLGLRDRDAAEAIGVAPPQLSLWKRGVQAIPPHHHAALVEFLRRSCQQATLALGESLITSGPRRSIDAYRLQVARASEILKALDAEAAEKGNGN